MMNKKIKLLILASIIMLCATMSLNVFAQDKIKLTLADTTAPTGLRGNGVKVFLEEVEKATNGRVEVEVYWGSSLLEPKEILSGVEQGVADMGYLNPNYYPVQMLAHGAFSVIPQGPERFTSIYKVYERCYKEIPELTQELTDRNQKLLYINSVLPLAVVSTEPFTSFEDFKGKRVRAASRWWLAELGAAGATPVSVPWNDCYMALQTGTIEAIFTNLDGEHRTKLDEPGKHVFTFKELWYGLPMLYTINLDVWNGLPVDIQAQLIKAGKAASIRFGEEVYEAEWDRIVKEQKEMGCIVNHATPEDYEKWVNMPVIEELQMTWVKEAKESGYDGAEEIMSKLKQIVQEAIN